MLKKMNIILIKKVCAGFLKETHPILVAKLHFVLMISIKPNLNHAKPKTKKKLGSKILNSNEY